jgi:hypothetical protein
MGLKRCELEKKRNRRRRRGGGKLAMLGKRRVKSLATKCSESASLVGAAGKLRCGCAAYGSRRRRLADVVFVVVLLVGRVGHGFSLFIQLNFASLARPPPLPIKWFSTHTHPY